MDVKDLVKRFDLDSEVERFVKGRVRELVAGKRHEFSFEGHPSPCDERVAHIPHVRGQYSTVRYGVLENFCSGMSGATDAGELTIVVESWGHGSAEWPSHVRGYWFID